METNGSKSAQYSMLFNFLVTLFLAAPGIAALFLLLSNGSWSGQKTVIGNQNGNRVMITTALDGAPRILFYDTKGNAPLTVQLTPTGVPMISMDSPNGGRAINISTALEGGRPQIMLFNPENGKAVWSVKVDKDGKPIVTDHTLSDN